MKIIDFEPLTILTKKLHLRCLVLKTALNIGKMYMPLGGVKNLTYPLISRENRGQYASKNEHSISKLCEVTSKSLEMKHDKTYFRSFTLNFTNNHNNHAKK